MFRLTLNESICVNLLPWFRVGFDLVKISELASSIHHFGDVFKRKLFTKSELNYAHSGTGLCEERLATRFAAKEAVIKALQLSEAGIGWREIEVLKLPDGNCEVALHGLVAKLAKSMGVAEISLSLSHDGDYAGAVVALRCSHTKVINSPYNRHPL